MDYINIFFNEIYKIIFLLLPVLVSVALIVWLDRIHNYSTTKLKRDIVKSMEIDL